LSTQALSLALSSSSTTGALSSTDWSTFNGKQNAITLTTTGTSGAATLIGSTLNIPQYADQYVGTVTSVAALTIGTTGTDLSSSVANGTTTPVITLNVPTASATNRGALSSADWTTFNNKQNTITNPVTGTGTTNYLPKWTSGSAIGNSIVQDNGSSVGIGVSSFIGGYKLEVSGLQRNFGANNELRFGEFDSNYNYFQGVNQAGTVSKGFIFFGTTEYMRITDGGNLLVNSTTDNGNRLQVTGTASFTGNVTSNVQFISNNGTVETRLSYSSTPAGVVGTISNHPLELYTNGNAKATISTSGNLGLGVQPSAWGSTYKVLQFPGGYVGSDSTLVNGLGQNFVWSGSASLYVNNGFACDYYQYVGQHVWRTAPSGTAGNAITFTQAMTLTSGGNLLVGTTTDSGEKLQVDGSAKITGNTIIGNASTADVFSRAYSGKILGISSSGQSAIELNSATGNGVYFDMGVNSSRTLGIYSDTTNSEISTTGAYPLLLSTNSVPRLTIKTNGSINYTPMATPASAVAGDVYYDSTSNKLRCYNGTSWNDLF
jgi:hypothetical protein